MGILMLEYGYFAFRGRRSVVNRRESKYNRDSANKIKTFARLWFDFYQAGELHIAGPKGAPKDFQIFCESIFSENRVSHFEKLREIIAESNGRRYAIVVPDIRVDILQNCMLQGEDRSLLSSILGECSKWNLQILSIESEKHPLKFRKRPTAEHLNEQIMHNGAENRDILQNFLNARLGELAA